MKIVEKFQTRNKYKYKFTLFLDLENVLIIVPTPVRKIYIDYLDISIKGFKIMSFFFLFF